MIQSILLLLRRILPRPGIRRKEDLRETEPKLSSTRIIWRNLTKNQLKKMPRSESPEMSDKVAPRKGKASHKDFSQTETMNVDEINSMENDTEKNDLECPMCEYRTKSACAWVSHLRFKHSTSPAKAGYFLRCECGYECYSRFHSYECEIAN
ncbi:hypothetical protein PMAYCL1PPCAC_13777, partial [Pristionchus mayeri]